MPLKLNIGSSKKIGLPNYSSKGASINLELELDTSLASEPEELQERIKSLFQQAREAVDTELFPRDEAGSPPQNGQSTHGHEHRPPAKEQHASEGQIRALHAITNRLQIPLSSLLDQKYQLNQPEELSREAASQLIDELNQELDLFSERQ